MDQGARSNPLNSRLGRGYLECRLTLTARFACSGSDLEDDTSRSDHDGYEAAAIR
jgi:hypothetical protein